MVCMHERCVTVYKAVCEEHAPLTCGRSHAHELKTIASGSGVRAQNLDVTGCSRHDCDPKSKLGVVVACGGVVQARGGEGAF